MKNKRPLAAAVCFALAWSLGACAQKTSAELADEGIQHTQREEYARAEAAFQSAIRLDANNARAYVGLGGIYNHSANHAAALEAFKTAAHLDPVYAEAYYSLGYTYELMGDREEAERQYQTYRSLKSRLDGLLRQEREKR